MTTVEPTRPRTGTSRAVTYAWIILCAITIGSWWLAPGHSGAASSPSTPVTITVVLLGMIKGRLIIQYFMEVRTAPRWLELATDAWLTILWIAILAIYVWQPLFDSR